MQKMNMDIIDFVNSNHILQRQMIDEFNKFVDLLDVDSDKLDTIRRNYGILERNSFNIFESLDKYWREDFHEIILTQILNPQTKEIGNIEYLKIFITLLNNINESLNLNISSWNVMVENQIGNKEYGFIDTLISNEDESIIIESKINNAPDQEDQLARYYDYMTKIEKKKVLAIVYIRPAGDEKKMPPLDNYSEKYKETVKEISRILVPVSVVDTKNNMDLCHAFLDKCVNISEIEIAKTYIKQYSELLKISGGNKMIMNVEKEIFERLFSKDNVVKINDIGEIWDNRWLIIYSLIQDRLVEQFGFSPDGDNHAYKNINLPRGKKELSLAFIYDPGNKKIGDDYIFGFSYAGFNNKEKEVLEEVLKAIVCKNILADEVEYIEDWLIIKRLYICFDKPYEEIVEKIIVLFENLEKEVKKIEM